MSQIRMKEFEAHMGLRRPPMLFTREGKTLWTLQGRNYVPTALIVRTKEFFKFSGRRTVVHTRSMRVLWAGSQKVVTYYVGKVTGKFSQS